MQTNSLIFNRPAPYAVGTARRKKERDAAEFLANYTNQPLPFGRLPPYCQPLPEPYYLEAVGFGGQYMPKVFILRKGQRPAEPAAFGGKPWWLVAGGAVYVAVVGLLWWWFLRTIGAV